MEVFIHTPDFHKPFILQINASHSTIRAVLTQEDTSIERPVAYASCKLHCGDRQTAFEMC